MTYEISLQDIYLIFKDDPAFNETNKDEIMELYNDIFIRNDLHINDRRYMGEISEIEELNFYLGRKDALEGILSSCAFELAKDGNKALMRVIREDIEENKRLIYITKLSIFELEFKKLNGKV